MKANITTNEGTVNTAPVPCVYLSTIQWPRADVQRSRFVIHRGLWYFAEFETGEQFDFFCRTVGEEQGNLIARRWIDSEQTPDGCGNLYQSFFVNIDTIEVRLFWDMSEVPEGAKPIKALSNGSVVTCYFEKVGKTLNWYRPNPNATAVYHPLPLDQDIAHRRTYGVY